jgi:hypothetical protein
MSVPWRVHIGKSRQIRWTAAVACLAIALMAAACSESAEPEALEAVDFSTPLLDDGAVARIPLQPGLEQTVELSPRRIFPGSTLHIRSVVRNVSDEYKKGEALVCQLEIRTNMKFESIEPLILCFAYSAPFRLAPNDSLVLTAQGRVGSRPGVYAMAVRHLLDPNIVAKVRVRVHKPPVTTTDTDTRG